MKRDMHIHPFVMSMPERLPVFIERAIELGFEEICITDHMPHPVYRRNRDRLLEEQVVDYAAAVHQAAEAYADRIIIRCGVEMDYVPDMVEDIRRMIVQWPHMDLLLGSTHPALVVPGYQQRGLSFYEFAECMLQNALGAARSGLFRTITHLDIHRRHFQLTHPDRRIFTGEEDYALRHEKLLQELIHIMREEDQLLEINGGLLPGGDNPANIHPAPEIVQMALEAGVRFVYGSDAHEAKHIGQYYDVACSVEPYRQAMLKAEEDRPC